MDDADDSSQHYLLVERAIAYIRLHAVQQPSLEQIAQHIGLSEYHFQRIFTRWAGVSPKRFLQYLTKEHAKEALRQSADVLGASLSAGLSAPSRLHDLIVTCEAVTPGEYKAWGAGVNMRYGFANTPFGVALLAWTVRGICYFEFCEAGECRSVAGLQAAWRNASFSRNDQLAHAYGARIFSAVPGRKELHLVLRGTNFQIKVWEALLHLGPGHVVSYSKLAALIGMPRAQRAVGSALAANTVGYLIPCHRVLRESGEIGSYRWRSTRKAALLAWEAAQAETVSHAEKISPG